MQYAYTHACKHDCITFESNFLPIDFVYFIVFARHIRIYNPFSIFIHIHSESIEKNKCIVVFVCSTWCIRSILRFLATIQMTSEWKSLTDQHKKRINYPLNRIIIAADFYHWHLNNYENCKRHTNHSTLTVSFWMLSKITVLIWSRRHQHFRTWRVANFGNPPNENEKFFKISQYFFSNTRKLRGLTKARMNLFVH